MLRTNDKRDDGRAMRPAHACGAACKSQTCTLMALMPISSALRRFSASLVSTMMGMPGTLLMYQAAATRMALSFLSLRLSLASALMYVSLQHGSAA